MQLMPSVVRGVGRGGIEYVTVSSGEAEVRCYLTSKKIEASATSIDGIMLLPELYVLAHQTARAMYAERFATVEP